ncbi:MAG: ThiF family adenylyltransferase [Candidatus Hodarchaeota archaeon]
MKIIIYPSFEEEHNDLKRRANTYLLYGRSFDDFTVCHLTGFSKRSYPIGLVTIGSSPSQEPIVTAKELDYPYLHIMVEKDLSTLKVDLYQSEANKESIDVDIEYIDLDRLFVRIDQTETPLSVLSQKKVAIIGMGSGGALLALYLAKSGVKKFIFIDDDHIETHNIIRHICDLDNLGRFKTLAVKDFIEARIPDVKIKTVERKFDLFTKADFDFYYDLLADVNLIAAVSGEHDVNYAINDFIHSNQLNIPIIYAGTFDGVKGGLMFKVDPQNDDYCYHCIYSKPDENGSIQTKAIPTTIELEQKISYDRTLQEQLAQPGLGLDIDTLTMFVAKFSLDILLSGEEHGLYHFPYNFYMWFNRTIMTADETSVKYEGLELYYYEDLEKDPDCPFHGIQALDDNIQTEKEEESKE